MVRKPSYLSPLSGLMTSASTKGLFGEMATLHCVMTILVGRCGHCVAFFALLRLPPRLRAVRMGSSRRIGAVLVRRLPSVLSRCPSPRDTAQCPARPPSTAGSPSSRAWIPRPRRVSSCRSLRRPVAVKQEAFVEMHCIAHRHKGWHVGASPGRSGRCILCLQRNLSRLQRNIYCIDDDSTSTFNNI